MILVKVPYNLRVNDEVRIYEKLIGESGLKGVHIAPHTLRVASLTRLEPSKKAGLSLMKKLKPSPGRAWRASPARTSRNCSKKPSAEG